jgi:hypothetical protein
MVKSSSFIGFSRVNSRVKVGRLFFRNPLKGFLPTGVNSNQLARQGRLVQLPLRGLERRCRQCGELLPLIATKRRRYCASRCRSRAWRQRKRGAEGVRAVEVLA